MNPFSRRVAIALIAATSIAACGEPRESSQEESTSTGATTQTVTVDGDSARGLALMSAFRDSLPQNSGNTLRCASCHLEAGLRAEAMPWIGSAATYPRFRSRSGEIETLAMRVNDCIARSLAGKMIPEDSRDMRDMLAYLQSIGKTKRPEGVDTITLVGYGDLGEEQYASTCARCHGAAGEGTVIAPAVWGADSYSIGAGMARQKMFATFIRHNMPFDKPGTLSAQEAANIAAYVLSKPRQDYPGKEKDWPKGDAPRDVAYATDGARAAGKPLPPERPVLARRISPRD
jgi:thiosulfate dehydrogenase